MDERLDAALTTAYNVAYCCLVAAMLLMLFPAARARIGAVANQQVYAWRHGRWLGTRTPAPTWTTLLARQDLPEERTA